MIDHLREIQKRRLYLRLGFSSLFDYAVPAPQPQTSAAKAGGRTGRAIPAAVKREVWQRDRGRCSYVDLTSGRRCDSQHLLQIDHLVPYAQGGAAKPNNLRLLCAAHHRHRHAGAKFRRPDDDHQVPVRPGRRSAG